MWLLLYVDDIVLTGSHSSVLQHFIASLGKIFDLKDLGTLNYFLGIQVQTTSSGIHLSQANYACDSLKKACMLEKPSSTPAKVSPSAHDGPLLSSPTEFRMLVGCLQYLMLTRPDISFAVNSVGQYMSDPRLPHLLAVKRILRYIKGTIDHGLLLRPQPLSDRISAYSDPDWAWCVDTRRSTTGYLIYHGTNLVSWSSTSHGVEI
ncbi:uncharacterized mitochondrial protein AtMg00810-like [Malus sylvestris]|uniref:uncharacterized mitochondrial protein AtMg00810-like n=1 Tax=Malus sylvestris TaxID=3752 RepID=UPI0021AC19FD|nr:uncharacterized mitochondrial protein AtMg00810-like [Malus sylvestris]